MEQVLESVLTRLGKVSQVLAISQEKLQLELELRDIAIVLSRIENVADIAQYNDKKLDLFLTNAPLTTSITRDDIHLACAIVSLSNHPAVKSGKRYIGAIASLEELKAFAKTYEESKTDLTDTKAKTDGDRFLIDELASHIKNQQVVDIEKYLEVLTRLVYINEDTEFLNVVMAVVKKNADLIDKEVGSDYGELTECQALLDAYENRYQKLQLKEITNIYLDNIEDLLDKEKITLEEAKSMLPNEEEIYEYFLWRWMNTLLKGVRTKKVSSKTKLLEVESLYRSIVKSTKTEGKQIIYNTWIDDNIPTFAYRTMDSDLIGLIDELREGKDSKKNNNVVLLNKELGIIKNEKYFLFFKELPLNHILVITSGDLENMKDIITPELLRIVSVAYHTLDNWIISKSEEYYRLMDIANKIEKYWENRNMRG